MIRRAALGEKPALAAMIKAYIQELADLNVLDNPQGFMDRLPPELDLYWTDPSRTPYLVTHDDQIAGFALINQVSHSGQPVDAAIAEFYVTPKTRKQGIGRTAALTAFAAHPGQWEMWVSKANAPAQAFWKQTTNAPQITDHKTLDDEDGVIHRFMVHPTAEGTSP